jgi:hypothetical protein
MSPPHTLINAIDVTTGSTEVNRSIRPVAPRMPRTSRQMTAKVMTCSVVIARILPNRMLVIKPDCADPKLTNRIPKPDANAKTVPVTTSRSRFQLAKNHARQGRFSAAVGSDDCGE